MQPTTIALLGLLLAAVFYVIARNRAFSLARSGGGMQTLHSLPGYHGAMVAIYCAVPALLLLALWFAFHKPLGDMLVLNALPAESQPQTSEASRLFTNKVHKLHESGNWETSADPLLKSSAARLDQIQSMSRWFITLLFGIVLAASTLYAFKKVRPETRARQSVEKFILGLLFLCASLSVLTTVGIVFSVLFESLRFFTKVSPVEFITGLQWSPQTALRSDQVGASGSFGAVPLFTGTLLISAIAMLVAVPLGLMSAVYLAEYASDRFRSIAKPLLEILAGIPTVVYGFFAALTVAPALRNLGESIGLSVASESALAAGAVMGIMIIPFVSSLSDDVITAVPRSLREGSYGLGATRSETIRKVVMPAALPGIVGSILLAVSRAIGETMIVVMAAGLAAKLTANPLEAVSTVTVQIVTLLTGDQEFDSAKTLAAFALGLMLFVVTLCLNVIALYIVRRFREQYD